MKTVFKYPFSLAVNSIVKVPKGAKFLHVNQQYGQPCLWAEVESEEQEEEYRTIMIYGTGHKMENSPQRYLGTFFLDGGSLVFHAYELLSSQKVHSGYQPI